MKNIRIKKTDERFAKSIINTFDLQAELQAATGATQDEIAFSVDGEGITLHIHREDITAEQCAAVLAAHSPSMTDAEAIEVSKSKAADDELAKRLKRVMDRPDIAEKIQQKSTAGAKQT
jgi:hypothetical protein